MTETVIGICILLPTPYSYAKPAVVETMVQGESG